MIANFGLNNIIQFAVPVLMLLYPLAIVLIILALASPLFAGRSSVFASAMILTFGVSFFDGYSALVNSIPGASISALDSVVSFYEKSLPLYSLGLGWLLPALIGAAVGMLIPKSMDRNNIQQ